MGIHGPYMGRVWGFAKNSGVFGDFDGFLRYESPEAGRLFRNARCFLEWVGFFGKKFLLKICLYVVDISLFDPRCSQIDAFSHASLASFNAVWPKFLLLPIISHVIP